MELQGRRTDKRFAINTKILEQCDRNIIRIDRQEPILPEFRRKIILEI